MAEPTNRKVLPRSVNLHFWRPCNMSCGFCFATYEDTRDLVPRGHLDCDALLRLIDALASHGAEKLTLVGGEPTLCPWLDKLLARAKDAGLVTMIVSNGSRLLEPGYMERNLRDLDWLTLSVDSLDHVRNDTAGRTLQGRTLLGPELLEIGAQARTLGMRLKLNTVVHRLNHDEDLTAFVRELQPRRWKLFQVLPVDGQNHERFAEFAIDRTTFDAFVERHRDLTADGIDVVAERNEDMRGSYAMIDPAGRFYDSATGRHRYSDPILEVGVELAWSQILFDSQRFRARGGDYDFDVGVHRLIMPDRT
jgi:radical S-adenosyl methionine domain-containing protein 2